MHKMFLTTAAFAVFGLFGTAFAQDATQRSPDSGTGNAQNVEVMTCADLNEMDPAEAVAFLRGYQYAQTAANRSGGSGATTISGSSTSETSTSGTSASTVVGTAVTTGDVTGGVGTEAKGPQAILTSCFDVPATPLEEVLSGSFGTVN